MSTDTPDAPITSAPPRKGYAFFEHHNSNNARRRGRCGWVFNPKTGAVEFKSCVSIRTVRFPDGGPLPHAAFPPSRSRYTPHVGAKQLARATR